MKILDSQQINYCNLIRQTADKTEHLPGVVHEGLLYIKTSFFPQEHKEQALEYCRGKFLDAKGEISYLVVNDPTGFTIWVEDQTVELQNNQEKQDIVQKINLEELVTKMRNIGGLQIKNRRYNLRIYQQCFVASEAVTWMQEKLTISRKQAVSLGKRLVEEKWIHHVVDREEFQDKYLFYRFYWDEN
ncbi:Domain found in Dishevelled, Egl-10, and Pleckstrin (DEP) [Xenococcus sp. PCC 7305]|uniref:Domain found in dishevelled, Egl-10, and Pleckstrin (DEP) n=1 Tax=Xenococcus sp. PCC 7305 TaxID=102125 RepID=UPI0002ABDEDF|nr:Domain found in dishevelled, Egl-10, and Pleckstrin (DEP) [Xenococcus sp. PCC 7305]ELS00309.1 Domain found in Dishevelled, Egl-10, and Pleckstrin (DEP) [Xenococcus sp. PCC 7305]